MPLVFVAHISRQMVKSKPDCIFVFGDNTKRVGLGGQAAEMRGEPNTIGIATKRSPSMSKDSFFSDDSDEDWATVKKDIAKVKHAIKNGKIVYVSFFGLGTGLSRLDVKAPKIYKYIIEQFKVMSDKCPWR